VPSCNTSREAPAAPTTQAIDQRADGSASMPRTRPAASRPRRRAIGLPDRERHRVADVPDADAQDLARLLHRPRIAVPAYPEVGGVVLAPLLDVEVIGVAAHVDPGLLTTALLCQADRVAGVTRRGLAIPPFAHALDIETKGHGRDRPAFSQAMDDQTSTVRRGSGILVDVPRAAPGSGCVLGSHNLPAPLRMDNLHSNDS
jgi:hypothetical protein